MCGLGRDENGTHDPMDRLIIFKHVLNVGIFSLGVGLSRAIDIIEKNVLITMFPTKYKIMLS